MDIDEIDERIEPTNYDKKLMIIIFIGIKGLVLLTHKPANQSINSDFFIENVLKPLEEITNVKDVKKKRKVMYIHFDNAPAHSSCVVKDYFKSSLLKQLPHPPYSPDLAPCDFGLLGTMKETFQGLSFDSEEDLIEAIKNFFNEMPPQFWENIFNNWIERLHKCICAAGDYFE